MLLLYYFYHIVSDLGYIMVKQCSSVEYDIYVLRKAHNYALHLVSERFPQCYL